METILLIKSHPLYGVLIVLLVAFLGYLLRVSLLQRQGIKTAGENIVDAFQEELDRLIQEGDDCRLILDSKAFKKHEAAIRNNIDNLSIFQRNRLRQAWDQLAYHKNNNQIPFYEMYADCGSLHKRAKTKPLAISRIQRIVSIVG